MKAHIQVNILKKYYKLYKIETHPKSMMLLRCAFLSEKIDYYERTYSENQSANTANGELFFEENRRRNRRYYRCSAVVYRKHDCRGNIASRKRCKLIDGKQND